MVHESNGLQANTESKYHWQRGMGELKGKVASFPVLLPSSVAATLAWFYLQTDDWLDNLFDWDILVKGLLFCRSVICLRHAHSGACCLIGILRSADYLGKHFSVTWVPFFVDLSLHRVTSTLICSRYVLILQPVCSWMVIIFKFQMAVPFPPQCWKELWSSNVDNWRHVTGHHSWLYQGTHLHVPWMWHSLIPSPWLCCWSWWTAEYSQVWDFHGPAALSKIH